MGVDIRKQIITGSVFSFEELGEEFIDNFVEIDGVNLIGLDNYGDKKLPSFIIGIVDKYLSGDGDRAQGEKEELIELETNPESQSRVMNFLQQSGLDVASHPIKTCRVTYFS